MDTRKARSLLAEELESGLAELKKLEVGSEEYRSASDALTKIADRIIEIDKLNVNVEEAREDKMVERGFKDREMKAENRDRFIRYALEVGKIGATLAAGMWIHVSGMRYDKDGVLPTTEGGRSVARQFLNFIKL